MSFTPSALQTLVLFRLVFSGQEPKQSEVKQLSPRSRQAMVEAGFLELEKRGRAYHIRLTDKAWAWISEHLDAQIPTNARTVETLQALLIRLKEYLDTQEIPLVEFLQPKAPHAPLPEEPVHSIEDMITQACTFLSGGQTHVRVRLKDLRAQLDHIQRSTLDQVLLSMQREGKLVLMHLDDPQDRTETDEAAALSILGQKRHIVYVQDTTNGL